MRTKWESGRSNCVRFLHTDVCIPRYDKPWAHIEEFLKIDGVESISWWSNHAIMVTKLTVYEWHEIEDKVLDKFIEICNMLKVPKEPIPTHSLRIMNDLIKQVIIVRTDLNMRKGKMIAQGAHASTGWLKARLLQNGPVFINPPVVEHSKLLCKSVLNVVEYQWLLGSERKIVVGIDSEEKLFAIETEALLQGITVCRQRDLGLTEFDKPTVTAIALGPDTDERLDPITKNLKLL